jgi:hypothetical protein
VKRRQEGKECEKVKKKRRNEEEETIYPNILCLSVAVVQKSIPELISSEQSSQSRQASSEKHLTFYLWSWSRCSQ